MRLNAHGYTTAHRDPTETGGQGETAWSAARGRFPRVCAAGSGLVFLSTLRLLFPGLARAGPIRSHLSDAEKLQAFESGT